MKWIKQLSRTMNLKFKFILGTLSLIVILLLGMLLAAVLVAKGKMFQQVKSQGTSMCESVASTSSYYVIFALKENLQDIINTILLDESVVYADFINAAGEPMAQGDSARLPGMFEEFSSDILRGVRDTTADGEDVLIFTYPILEAKIAREMNRLNITDIKLIKCVSCHAEENIPELDESKLRLSEDQVARSHKDKNVYEFGSLFEVPGYLRIALSTKPYYRARNSLIGWMLVITVLAIILATGLIQLATAITVKPIINLQTSASRFAQGDLTQRVEVLQQDEVGGLMKVFNQMAENLEVMVSRIKQGHEKLNEATDVINTTSHKVLEQSHAQIEIAETAYQSVDKLNRGIQEINRNVENLSTSSEETSSSVLEMVASMEEVTKHTDSLFASVDETANVATEMVASINEIDHNMENLSNFVTETSASMMQMDATISEVENNADEAYELSVDVSRQAEGGMKAVQDTIVSMGTIKDAVGKTEQVILNLGKRSEEIGKILTVIDEIAEQTNLLALNAAILAAQAGEHGKGFSVVASEIRDLSERTATSTKEITELVKNVQLEVSNAVSSTKEAKEQVNEGVSLSNTSGKVLGKILEASMQSANMVKEIANATKEQANSSQAVTKSAEQVREMVKQITKATSEQSAGSKHIMDAVENMREMTSYVKQATQEQKSGSLMISEATEKMMEMIHGILEVTSNQAEDSNNITQVMEQVKVMNQESKVAVEHLQEVMKQLMIQTEALEEVIQRFKIRV